ncbi:hypothetical protein [Bacillus sp. 1P06AnD]|uniref:hypothetical protein n=1 Tax=Bacillus sp. 1P06AnD TaxID=3132208 RepID=UPI0039A0B2C5
MKKKLLLAYLCLALAACSQSTTEKSTQKSNSHLFNKDFIKQNAEIGISVKEAKNRFGKEKMSGKVEHSEVSLFDQVKKGYDYKPDLENVAFKQIKDGKVKGQLFIIFKDEKAFMFSFFYRGTGGDLGVCGQPGSNRT